MDLLYELRRFSRIDDATAKEYLRRYLAATTKAKQRYGKRHAYRRAYLESMLSFRFLLRRSDKMRRVVIPSFGLD